jgi:hypothetical protein
VCRTELQGVVAPRRQVARINTMRRENKQHARQLAFLRRMPT